jgi:hypothetical protein
MAKVHFKLLSSLILVKYQIIRILKNRGKAEIEAEI